MFNRVILMIFLIATGSLLLLITPNVPHSGGESDELKTSREFLTNKYIMSVELKQCQNLKWTADLESALLRAHTEKKHVFVGFVGTFDANSEYNFANFFSKKEISSQLAEFVNVLLYIDSIPTQFFNADTSKEIAAAEADANCNFLTETMNRKPATPIYYILKPRSNGKFQIVDSVDGLLKDVNEFAEFLRKSK